jgi:hypothetical protein
MSPRLEEVFKTNGIPTHTFVEPREWQRLQVALRAAGRGVVIEGPSGIGKTTAVETALAQLGIADILKLSARKPADIEYIEALPTLSDAGTVLVDDFHKLSDVVKSGIADYMKSLADEETRGTKLIVVGINNAGNSLIEFAPDLVNRIEVIAFENNPSEKVARLIHLGEEALNISINIRNELRDESHGSFYIAQMLCNEVCLRSGVLERKDEALEITESIEAVKADVFDRFSKVFWDVCQVFARGTKMRPHGRAPYLHILYWLSQSEQWSLDLTDAIRKHPELKGSVGQVVDRGYLLELLDSNSQLGRALHYDASSKELVVEDPQFVFFLRNIPWLKFARAVGFDTVEFTNRYDFALSFAGVDRPIAQALFDGLVEAEVEVFYDKNEQHRILAEDVEEYLRPIYQTEARFVVCLLGPEYPKRVWTKFESDAFKNRFEDGDVIPVWFSSSPPGVFDESRRVGGFQFDVDGDHDEQVAQLRDLLLKKLSEARIDDAKA